MMLLGRSFEHTLCDRIPCPGGPAPCPSHALAVGEQTQMTLAKADHRPSDPRSWTRVRLLIRDETWGK